MKKILFGTTALLAAGAFVSTAQASDPIKLKVGGYMEYYVVAADQDENYTANSVNTVDVQSDAEVFFKGKTTLDNGMTVGADIQLEASSTADTDTIDEAYLYVSGKYGKLIVGAENSAAYLMNVSAPGVSPTGTVGKETDVDKYLLNGVAELEVISNTLGDAPKLTYFTPKMYGLQAAVSYVPSGDTNGDETADNIARTSNWDEAWSFGLKYADKFEGVGIKASATYELIDDNSLTAVQDNEVQNIGAGLNLSYMGATVGGGVRRFIANDDTARSTAEGTAWNAGVSYKEGPYGVSATYYTAKMQGTTGNNLEDELRMVQVAGTYKLGAGVLMFAEIAYSDSDDELLAAQAADNDGAIGGAMGLKLSF